MGTRSLFVLAALVFSLAPACKHIEITPDIAGGGMLEDAVLVTSVGGAPPRKLYKLGDIDLSQATLSFSHNVPSSQTHWWLIGHMGGEVVYTSNIALGGISIYSTEPYNMPGANVWNIANNLDGLVNGTGHSIDWWAQTVNNHTTHVAPDENGASGWRFSPAGRSLGSLTVDLSK